MRASRNGIITGLDISLGQQVTEGTRIAAIGDSDKFRLNAELDEYYIDKITVGLTGHASIAGSRAVRVTVTLYSHRRTPQ